jgi:hypothetical protein
MFIGTLSAWFVYLVSLAGFLPQFRALHQSTNV